MLMFRFGPKFLKEASWTMFGKLGGETDVEHEAASVSVRFE